ncbi:MAG: excinuclease ABC subunit UvrC [Coriobacteriia bacterium]|nr:excinuclease ABC subunit UvrC [Coriobacteriia bacterium]
MTDSSSPKEAQHKPEGEHKLVALIDQVRQVPSDPGCYLWKDEQGSVLYVGKAKNLRARMMQYVLGQDEREKIPLMMHQVASFDYVVVSSEHESLILEKNLIQQYHPPYNVDYRDDKSYPFIAITASDSYPAIKFTREKHKSGTHYFGPYTDSRAARQMIDIARRTVSICSAHCTEWKRIKRLFDARSDKEALIDELKTCGKPCFDFHVGKGPGACVGEISPEEYRSHVHKVERFLSGKRKEIVEELTNAMHEAAEELEFERAGRIKQRLDTINSLQDKQKVVFKAPIDIDMLGFYREETIAGAHVFVVREGRVIISNDIILNKGMDVEFTELIEGFMKRYYEQTSDIPHEIYVPTELPDANLLSSWLSEKRGTKVHIRVAQRGDKKSLQELADKNAKHALMRFKVRTRYDDERTNLALLELESALALPSPPLRIECFDISTIHGKFSVASMVVFTNGKPDTSQYRRFKIRLETEEANDFAMMQEAIARRYAPKNMEDARFGSKPNLLIVDGGKPQLSAAIKELSDLGHEDIPVAGLAKADEELFVPWSDTGPVVLPSGSASLYLVKQVRDEAHRFAISYHRALRKKAMTTSILDEIDGIGPKRKKALRRHFSSMKNLRAASVEELAQVPGIPYDLAETIYAYLQGSA